MGGGGIGTVSAVITGDLFEVRDRAFYQGLVFVGFGAGMGLGGPIGGYLTHLAGWRSAFYGGSRLHAPCETRLMRILRV